MADEHDGVVPDEGLEVTGEVGDNPEAQNFAMYAYGAQFAEVRVSSDTGEVRVPLLGGISMGLSMALHEESVLDPRCGDFVNHDFAEYHVATNATGIRIRDLPIRLDKLLA